MTIGQIHYRPGGTMFFSARVLVEDSPEANPTSAFLFVPSFLGRRNKASRQLWTLGRIFSLLAWLPTRTARVTLPLARARKATGNR